MSIDNWEECGDSSWVKVRELRKIIGGFSCQIIQNHKGYCTDDDEFYFTKVMKVKSEAELLDEAMGSIYYFDNVREHSALNYQTPFA